MSQPPLNTSLSRSARLLCYLGPPSTILFTSISSPKAGLLTPLAFLPTAFLYQKWRKANDQEPSRRGKLEPMVWIYAATGTIGLTASALTQLALFLGLKYVVFGSSQLGKDFWAEIQRTTNAGRTPEELIHRAKIAATWQNWFFNTVFMFVSAGLVEETLKYLPIAYARRSGTPEERKPRDRAYIDYTLAAALGFGLVEGIGNIYQSCVKGQERWPQLLLTIFERMVLGQAGHLSTACLTALRATRRDYYGDNLSWWSVIGPSVILHGLFNSGAMAASSLEGNVGWVHPTEIANTITLVGAGISLVSTTVYLCRKEWKGLDERDVFRKHSGKGDHDLSGEK